MKNKIVKIAIVIGLCTLFANSASAKSLGEKSNTEKHQTSHKKTQKKSSNTNKTTVKPTKKITPKIHAKNKAVKGQNAFTRAVQKPLEGILTPVENTNTTPCNSVVECRKYGGDLKTVWQANNTTDYSPKDYPERCYVLGSGGKYVYSAGAC